MAQEKSLPSVFLAPEKPTDSSTEVSGPHVRMMGKKWKESYTSTDIHPGPSKLSTKMVSLHLAGLSEKDVDVDAMIHRAVCHTGPCRHLYSEMRHTCMFHGHRFEFMRIICSVNNLIQYCKDHNEKISLTEETQQRLSKEIKRTIVGLLWSPAIEKQMQEIPEAVRMERLTEKIYEMIREVFVDLPRRPVDPSISVKVCDVKRSVRVGLAAKTLEELKSKICRHCIPGSKDKFDVVLEEDCTIIDDEYFQSLEDDTKLMVIGEGQTWITASSSAEFGLVEVDGQTTQSCSSNDLAVITTRIAQNISVLVSLSEEQLKLVADADISELQVMLHQSMDYTTFIRDACKRRLRDILKSHDASVLLSSLTDAKEGLEKTGEEEPDMAGVGGVPDTDRGSPAEVATPVTSGPEDTKTTTVECDKPSTSTDIHPDKRDQKELSIKMDSSGFGRLLYDRIHEVVRKSAYDIRSLHEAEDRLERDTKHHIRGIVHDLKEELEYEFTHKGYDFPMGKWERLHDALRYTIMTTAVFTPIIHRRQVEDELCEVIREVLFDLPRRPVDPISVKVCDVKRSVRVGLAAKTLEELKSKICRHDIPGSKDKFDVVLEEDCTIIDDEYFQSLEDDTKLMVIGEGQPLTPDGGMVEVDGESPLSLATIVNRINQNVMVVPFLSNEELELVAEADINELQAMLHQSMDYATEIQEACDRRLIDKMTTQNAYDYLEVCNQAKMAKEAKDKLADQPTTSE